jgi:hypothetical protein
VGLFHSEVEEELEQSRAVEEPLETGERILERVRDRRTGSVRDGRCGSRRHLLWGWCAICSRACAG